MLYHLHGFNSGPGSHTQQLLSQHFPVHGLSYNCATSFAHNLEDLRRQVEEHPEHGPTTVISGMSLGGLYAGQLSALLNCPCVLFNPVIAPLLTLPLFLGPNVNFLSGQAWYFSEETVESYARCTDIRPLPLPRLVVLGLRDTLLPAHESRQWWEGYAHIHQTNDEHSIASLDKVTIEGIRKLMNPSCQGRRI